MNCKNCYTTLNTEQKYCNECGAKVVTKRITINNLIESILMSIGWDNRFLVTFRDLLIRPQIIVEQYLTGTRKKYTNPFTFFAIGAALSVFVLNFYSEQLIEISTKVSLKPSETVIEALSDDINNTYREDNADYLEKQQTIIKNIVDFQFKYYYYLSFLFLPFFAFISFLVFGKPNNYGEHLVINAYIQGILFFFGLLLFFLTLLIRSDVYSAGSILLTILYYCYLYKRYRKYTLGQTLKKLLKFFAVTLVLALSLVVIGYFSGLLIGK